MNGGYNKIYSNDKGILECLSGIYEGELYKDHFKTSETILLRKQIRRDLMSL
ncbi:MAG: hypothetical protein HRU09_18160 [Oligoflexales bacterium]|nr:hypothetical protein [Oligoflexales bacterium]